MTNKTLFNFTVSYNKKRWDSEGTCYTQTIKLPKELKAPLIEYLKKESNSERYTLTNQAYIKSFVEKLEQGKMEAGAWYSLGLTPTRCLYFFLVQQGAEGRIYGKRHPYMNQNTALIFI